MITFGSSYFLLAAAMSLDKNLPQLVLAVALELNLTHLVLVAPTSQGKVTEHILSVRYSWGCFSLLMPCVNKLTPLVLHSSVYITPTSRFCSLLLRNNHIVVLVDLAIFSHIAHFCAENIMDHYFMYMKKKRQYVQ